MPHEASAFFSNNVKIKESGRERFEFGYCSRAERNISDLRETT